MYRFLRIALLLAFVLCQAAESRAEYLTVEGRTVYLTVYNNGDAFMVERRNLQLDKGPNEILWKGLPKGLRKDSVQAEILSPEASIVEQSVGGANLKREEIERRFINQTVKAVSRNPQTGEDTAEDAVLLGVDNGYLLQFGNRIETDFPGRLVFPYLPPDLYEDHFVRLRIDSKTTSQCECLLSYMLQDVDWQAEYSGLLATAGDSMQFGAWARIDNSGDEAVTADDATLVAGALHRMPTSPPPPMRLAAGLAAKAAAPVSQPEEFGAYYRYDLRQPLSVNGRSAVSYALFADRKVPCGKEFRIIGNSSQYRANQGHEPLPQKAQVVLLAENTKADNLGMPLPAGRVRIYQAEASGRVAFAGEDAVAGVPQGGKLEITLGESFDVRAERSQLSFSLLPSENRNGYAYESVRSVKVINGGKEKVRVLLTESFPGEWSILKKNFEPAESSAYAATWLLDVAAGGDQTLLYTVRVKER